MEQGNQPDRRVALGPINKEEPSTTRRSIPSATRQSIPSTTRRSDKNKGWHSRGYLPHVDASGLIQHITFHTADSLPAKAVERMEYEIRFLPDEEQKIEKWRRVHELLDSGAGTCPLQYPENAQTVEDSLIFGDKKRYQLLAWVIMPNHVHVLIEQQDGWPLSKIVQSWKRHTSRTIHLLDAGSPSCTRPLWQRDYWDRYIRNPEHFAKTKHYIENNPVNAGLVKTPVDWQWSSAILNQEPSATRRS